MELDSHASRDFLLVDPLKTVLFFASTPTLGGHIKLLNLWPCEVVQISARGFRGKVQATVLASISAPTRMLKALSKEFGCKRVIVVALCSCGMKRIHDNFLALRCRRLNISFLSKTYVLASKRPRRRKSISYVPRIQICAVKFIGFKNSQNVNKHIFGNRLFTWSATCYSILKL